GRGAAGVRVGWGTAGSLRPEARGAAEEKRRGPPRTRVEVQRPQAASAARVARVVRAGTDPVGTAVPGGRGLAATPGVSTSPTAPLSQQSAPALTAGSRKWKAGTGPAGSGGPGGNENAGTGRVGRRGGGRE